MKRLLFLLPLFFTMCAKEESAHGWEDLELHCKEIQVGKTTKEEVLQQFGPPTSTDITTAKEWYFVQLIEEGFSISKPKVKVHKMLKIGFDNKDVVRFAQVENIQESKQKIVSETTKTQGYEEGFIKDTFGRVGQR